MSPELPCCHCLLSCTVNATPDVAIGVATVISYVPCDQGGGQSHPGGGVSIPIILSSDHFLQDQVQF